MKQFKELLQDVLDNGSVRTDRTGTGTIATFGKQIRYDITDGKMPLLQGKRVPYKNMIAETLWLIAGKAQLKPLLENNVIYWSEWPHDQYCKEVEAGRELEYCISSPQLGKNIPYELRKFEELIVSDTRFNLKYGYMGPIYPEQWRAFKGPGGTVDQLQNAVNDIRNNHDSRRIIVDSWQPTQLTEMCLPPCHYNFQFDVEMIDDVKHLSCMVLIRSNDLFLGHPVNAAQYALLTHMLAKITGCVSKDLIVTIGNCHIYSNHVDQVAEYMQRPIEREVEPTVVLHGDQKEIDDFKLEDIEIINYAPEKRIKAPIAV